MISRDRVLRTINHQEPDRIPIDFNPLLEFYLNLKSHLNCEINEDVKCNSAMEVIPHNDVLKKVGIDITSVKLAGPSKPREQRPDGLTKDVWGVLRKKVAQNCGAYMETVFNPLKEATIEDLRKFAWPKADNVGIGEETEREARRKYEDSDLAIVGRFGGPIIETCMELLGIERWFIGLASEPEFISILLENVTNVQIECDKVGLEAAAKYIQIFKVSGEDFGAQDGPLFSIEMLKNQLLPHLCRRWNAAREYLDEINPKVKLMLHSCGSIRSFIPLLIENKIDILDPVQPRAKNMDSKDLKNEFGKNLVFHGGIDIQNVLPRGSSKEIQEEVRKRIADYGPGGGYILAASHNVQADVPPESFMTMVESVKRWGTYPIG